MLRGFFAWPQGADGSSAPRHRPGRWRITRPKESARALSRIGAN